MKVRVGRTCHLVRAIGLAIGLCGPVRANLENDTGAWFMSLSQGSLGDENSRWLWWLDLHARFSDHAEGFEQSIFRPGFGYQLDGNQSLWMGYGWIATQGTDERFSQEHRIWQQHIWSGSHHEWDWLCRSRLEQRFFDTEGDLGLRYRQFLKANYWPDRSGAWYLTAYNEIFVHLNDTRWGANAGLDRNRLFVGIGFRPGPAGVRGVEIGYLNQWANRNNRPNRMTHIASFNLFTRF